MSWAGGAELHVWAEGYYAEQFVTASGTGNIRLRLAGVWSREPMTITVGLPRSTRASGGLAAPVPFTLTAVPASANAGVGPPMR